MRSCLFCLLSLLLTIPAYAATGEPQKTVIVLDASGSMWGQIKGTPKIKLAKDVVSDLVKDWDPAVSLGLTAYGHRKKGDCNDIEALIPIGTVQQAAFNKALQDINPKGKTPLSAAVKQAAEDLKYTEARATVILVSDGIETCDADPCAVANALEAAGIDFTAHVIGFDIKSEQEQAQLRCIAENTGGKFMAASDADELKSSLEEAVSQVTKLSNNLRLYAITEEGGEPLTDGVRWEVFEKATDEMDTPEILKYSARAQPELKLPAGEYLVRAVSIKGQAQAEKIVSVREEELTEEQVLLAKEGNITLKAVNEAGGEALKDVYWQLYPLTKDDLDKPQPIKYGRGDTPTYKLLPGTYRATVRSNKGEATAEKEVTVVAGKNSTEEVVIAEEGEITLRAVNEAGGEALKDVYWQLYPLAKDDMDKPQPIKYGRGNTPTYKLLPGTYRATVQSNKGEATAEKEVTVVAGKSRTEEVLMAAEGLLDLVAVNEEGGEPVSGVYFELFTIVPENSMDKPERIKWGRGDTPQYKLLPGKYLVKVRANKGKATAEQEVTVVAGKKVREEVLLPAEGIVKLLAVTEPGGTPDKEVRWTVSTIVDESSMDKPERVAFGRGATPEYRLLPGKYMAKVEAYKGMAEAEQEIEVIAGKKQDIEVVIPAEGLIQINAVAEPGGAPLSKVFVEMYTEPMDEMSKGEKVRYWSGNSKQHRMLPGRYLARVIHAGSNRAEKIVQVEAGKLTQEEIVVSQ